MKVSRAFEVLKSIVDDYDRTPNEGAKALDTLAKEISDLTTRIIEDFE